MDTKSFQKMLTENSFLMTLEEKSLDASGVCVIITVPHDAGMSSCDFDGLFEERESGYKMRDKHVWPIARDVVLHNGLRGLITAAAVRGMIHRKYIDYNRPSFGEGEVAYSDPRLQECYWDYHHAIARLISKYLGREPRKVLLLDFHGFTRQPPYAPEHGFDIILGTRNRETVCLRGSEKGNNNPDLLLARWLRAGGYSVFCPGEDSDTGGEPVWYDAAYTAWHYSQTFHINAIQVEIAARFRQRSADRAFHPGKMLALDIARYLKSLEWYYNYS